MVCGTELTFTTLGAGQLINCLLFDYYVAWMLLILFIIYILLRAKDEEEEA